MRVMIRNMNAPIKNGTRVIVGDNFQPYAKAIVVDCVYVAHEARWGVVLEWPNAPGGPGYSRVWADDEGKGWRRWTEVN